MSDLSKMTKAQLLEHASEIGVDSVSDGMTKSEIISVIEEVVDERDAAEDSTPEFDLENHCRSLQVQRGAQFASGYKAGYLDASK